MIDFRNLTRLNENLDEFMKRIMEYNIGRGDFKPKSKIEPKGFYKYMIGLSEFGQMIFSSDYNLSIYKLGNSSAREIFYAIDETGLSHGFILGPQLDGYFPEPYYGHYEKSTYNYDCVVKMGATTYEDSIPVDVELLKKEFLPLQKGNDYKNYCFFSAKYLNDFGPTIYRHKSRSFYLPLAELVAKEINAKNHTINVRPKYEKDYIALEFIHFYNTRKYDHTSYYMAKVSYESFEILDLENTNYEKEYNW